MSECHIIMCFILNRSENNPEKKKYILLDHDFDISIILFLENRKKKLKDEYCCSTIIYSSNINQLHKTPLYSLKKKNCNVSILSLTCTRV